MDDELAFSSDEFDELPDLATRLANQKSTGIATLLRNKEFNSLNTQQNTLSSASHGDSDVILVSSDDERDEVDDDIEVNENEVTFVREINRSVVDNDASGRSSGKRRRVRDSDVSMTEASVGCPKRLAPIFTAANQSQHIETFESPAMPRIGTNKRKILNKKMGVEERKRERERVRMQKMEEKERLKQEKLLEKAAKKSDTLAESTKWLVIHMSEDLLTHPSMSEVPSAAAAAGLTLRAERDAVVREAVTFTRVNFFNKKESLEDHAIVVPRLEQFLDLVQGQVSGQGATLQDECRAWKRQLCVTRLTLFVWQLEPHHRSLKNSQKKQSGSFVPNRLDVETALAVVQLQEQVNHRIFCTA
ncbi:uncharacterized protein LOC108670096 [Hyalella azteca]|uniref:Uncharacterized protein LOC108670096 n=1 Tax=Hyalella azteca TaxID=294128 RepID=A0A979FSR6_HYAAZ|nr:uncharacterized protein LOC108670096 [Hyalella azteca]